MIIFVAVLIYKRNYDDHLNQLNELGEHCRCKLGSVQRIVNGQIQDKLFIPWQTSIARVGYHICMGTIINQYWILTAQHCINKTSTASKNLLEVRVGLYELFDPKIKEKTYRVSEVYKFPSFDYSNSLRGGDLAMVKLTRPIQFEAGLIEPACLDLDGYDSKSINRNDVSVEEQQNATDAGSTNNTTKELFVSSGFGTSLPIFYQKNKFISEITPSLVLKTAYFTEVVDLFKMDPRLEPLLNLFICIDPLDKESTENPCLGDSGQNLNYEDENGLTTVKGVACSSIPIPYNDTTLQFCKSYSMYSRLSYKGYKHFIEGIVGDLRCRVELIV